jgi:hypothetical protein
MSERVILCVDMCSKKVSTGETDLGGGWQLSGE